jgi:hypothetical protein
MRRRNTRDRWDWSQNPAESAIYASESLEVRISEHAKSTRRATT